MRAVLSFPLFSGRMRLWIPVAGALEILARFSPGAEVLEEAEAGFAAPELRFPMLPVDADGFEPISFFPGFPAGFSFKELRIGQQR